MNLKNSFQDKEARAKNLTFALIIVVMISFLIFCYLAQYPLIFPLVLIFSVFHLNFFQKIETKVLIHCALLLALLLFTGHIIHTKTTIPLFYIPIAGFVMLTMLLFNDLRLSFMMAFIGSLFISYILNGDFGMFLIFFIGSLTGAYGVREARTRGRLIFAGLFVSLMHLICLLLIYPSFSIFITESYRQELVIPLIANGIISVFLVKATLKMFEYLFGVLTNYSLLELSDFNQPLLKRMILEAPGTYHHSLIVSNMSEAAADVIGANSLLTRVGAYYHDIGKMLKPEYFTENQALGSNKHDNIEPSMSRLVILNHVKEGIDLAKKNRMNQRIIDFIPQHHGTSLIYYFYQKSLEDAAEGEEIDEAIFRYPGPKPQERETAIILLADSVEAATRSLKEPNPKNIEETVKKIINNKFIDGQLDECNLTLKDINQISSVFTRILNSMYHSRVRYPEKKNGSSAGTQGAQNVLGKHSANNKERDPLKNGNHHQKSSEEGKTSSLSDQEDPSGSPSKE